MARKSDRRNDDVLIQQLVRDVSAAMTAQTQMQASIDINTNISSETQLTVAAMKETVDSIDAMVKAMKILVTFSKWIAAITTMVTAIILFWKQLKGGG